MRAVAEAVLERLEDEIALDLGDGAADEMTRDLLGGQTLNAPQSPSIAGIETAAV